MQLFISVLRPLEEAHEARDLIVVVPEDATVGDLAAALDRTVPTTAPGQSLRLVVNAGEPVSAAPSSPEEAARQAQAQEQGRGADPQRARGPGTRR